MKKFVFVISIIFLLVLFSGEVMAENNPYQIKEGKVYFSNKVIENADADSFKVITSMYSHDKNFVYFCFYSKCEKTEIDPKTVELVAGSYIKDKNYVYCSDPTGSKRLNEVDVDTFEAISTKNLDNKNIYYSYGKDRKHVYYYCQEIINADLATFTPIDQHNSQDKNNIYYKNSVKESASVKGDVNNLNNNTNVKLFSRLKGKIMLKVEDAGKAYYIHPTTQKMHYLGRPDDAFKVMREQGSGIKNSDLEKIPVGLSNLSGTDTDADGLPDIFEDAIGTDKNKKDTDGDGYEDKTELSGNYNLNGTGKLNINNNFSNGQKGKIFLQVEKKGEAWYINPNDGKRYFLGRPSDAFNVMKKMGMGISNKDFDSLK